MSRSIPRPGQLAIAALTAPAISLVGAWVLAWVIGAVGLAASFPVGVHTYLPLAAVVPLPAVALAGAGGIIGALGVALFTRTTGPRLDAPIGRQLWQMGVLAAAVQVVLFAAQVLVVDELRGVPDSAAALLVASAIQAIFVALLATGGWLLSGAPRSLPAPAALRLETIAWAVVGADNEPRAARRAVAHHPRRGPPLLLVSPSN